MRKDRNYVTVKQLLKAYDWLNEGGVRYYIHNAEANGFTKCMHRAGRKILIDVEAFFEWLDEGGSLQKVSTAKRGV